MKKREERGKEGEQGSARLRASQVESDLERMDSHFSNSSSESDLESGGLRLKRDITEYGEFVRGFIAPAVDEKFKLLGIMANVFIVAPESLSTLFEGPRVSGKMH